MTKWRKFTNSLYLRLLMRVSNRRDMNSAERIKTYSRTSQYPIFEQRHDNATLKYSGTRPFVNDFGDNATHDDSAMGEDVSSTSWWTQATPHLGLLQPRKLRSQRGRLRGNHERRPGFGHPMRSRSADGASNSNNTTFRQYTSPYTFMTYSRCCSSRPRPFSAE